MKSLWNDAQARLCKSDLALRVYSSRLLGQDPSLVLHGGGNTSVKIRSTNILGDPVDLLHVKGSGWDLATIEEEGFPAVDLIHLVSLSGLPSLSDPEMVNELRTHMTSATSPTPSVEAILHAILPYKYVDHTHADAIVTITNTPDGEQRIRDVYGNRVLVIPYVMPGFELARVCAAILEEERNEQAVGMVLMNHGIFSFADTAQESYERMIELVGMAEDYLQQHQAWQIVPSGKTRPEAGIAQEIAGLRQTVSAAAGYPMIMTTCRTGRVMDFIERSDLAVISQQGPATPDHVIRTKQRPMIGRDVDRYSEDYQAYFAENQARMEQPLTMLDTAPRVVLDPQLGLCSIGRSVRDAGIVMDIYQHTMDVIERAQMLDTYQALPSERLFEVEYWDLEQSKLRKGGAPREFAGEVVLITGAASGIGHACVESMLNRGAAVIALDINADIETRYDRDDVLGLCCDITDEMRFAQVLEEGVRRFGGLDMLVLNAGVFPASQSIGDLSLDQWRRVMSVNLDANESILRRAYPLLKLAPAGGRVVVIGSKNVPAPGPGAAAYSASKAALTQLARVAALEWGGDGIRVNMLHPNAVFDTGIWTQEVLRSRAEKYGLTVEEYRQNNVLGKEVTSHDVSELAAAMCGPLFAKTTAAQVPVDGGNERVI